MHKIYDTHRKRLALLSDASQTISVDMTSDLEEERRVLNQILTDMLDVLTPQQVTAMLIKLKEQVEVDESELFLGASEVLRSTVVNALTSAIEQPMHGE